VTQPRGLVAPWKVHRVHVKVVAGAEAVLGGGRKSLEKVSLVQVLRWHLDSRGNGDMQGDARVERTDHQGLFLLVLATVNICICSNWAYAVRRHSSSSSPFIVGPCFHRGPKKELCLRHARDYKCPDSPSA
jgi:hypothetical protein